MIFVDVKWSENAYFFLIKINNVVNDVLNNTLVHTFHIYSTNVK